MRSRSSDFMRAAVAAALFALAGCQGSGDLLSSDYNGSVFWSATYRKVYGDGSGMAASGSATMSKGGNTFHTEGGERLEGWATFDHQFQACQFLPEGHGQGFGVATIPGSGWWVTATLPPASQCQTSARDKP